jgi:hypothetical protein
MSRQDLSPRGDQKAISRVVVGWDRPLQTFFVQAFAGKGDRERTVVWRGTALAELETPEAALAIASEYAIIPSDLCARLTADRLSSVAIEDGPAQAELKRKMLRVRF